MNPSENNRDPEFEPWVWKHLAERMRSEADGAGEDSWVDEIDEEELADACASLDALTVDGEAVERPLDETRVAEMVASVVDSDGREDDATILPGPGSTPPAAEEGGKVLEGPSRWSRLRIGAAALLLVAAGVRFFPSADADPDSPGNNKSVAFHTARMTDSTAEADERKDSMSFMLIEVTAALEVLRGVALEHPEVAELVGHRIERIVEAASNARSHPTPDDAIGLRLDTNRQDLLDGVVSAENLPNVVSELGEDCERVLTRIFGADFSSLEFVEENPAAAIDDIYAVRDVLLGRIVESD
ncbi:MAG: hypothetical protein AAF196_14055 [Planctomycetota bacterium]